MKTKHMKIQSRMMELNVLHNSRIQDLNRAKKINKNHPKAGPKSRRNQGQISMTSTSDQSSDTGEDTSMDITESQNDETDSDSLLRSNGYSRVEKVGGQSNKLNGPLSKQKQRQSNPDKLLSEVQSDKDKKVRGRPATGKGPSTNYVGSLEEVVSQKPIIAYEGGW